MKTLLKILVGLLLILLAALLLMPLLVDRDLVKEEIRARVAAATGRELTIEGELGISLFPWVGIELREASLSQAPGFGDRPFAHIREFQVRARLLSLLGGKMTIDEIRGTGLQLNLIREKDGRTNWADLVGTAGSDRITPIPAPGPRNSDAATRPPGQYGLFAAVAAPFPPSSESARTAAIPPSETPLGPAASHGPGDGAALARAQSPLARFEIAGVTFDEVHIALEDRKTGLDVILDRVTVTTGPLSRQAPVDLHLAGGLVERGLGLKSDLVLDATLRLLASAQPRLLIPLELRLERLTTAAGFTGAVRVKGVIQTDTAAHRYRSEDLTLELDVYRGVASSRPVRVDARTDLDLDLGSGILQLRGLSIDSGTARGTAEVTATGLHATPEIQGRLTLALFNLRAWLEGHDLWAANTTDPKALTAVDLHTDWHMTGQRLDLDPLEMTLDRTRITGKASLVGTAPSGYRFDLNADTLDLDTYLPPSLRLGIAAPPRSSSPAIPPPLGSADPSPSAPTPLPASPSKAPPTGWLGNGARFMRVANAETTVPPPLPASELPPTGPVDLFPVRFIRGLDLDGKVRLGQLRLFGLSLGDVDAKITVKDDRLRVEEHIGRFYRGKLQGHALLSARQSPPQVALAQQADGIQAGPLLEDLIGDDLVTGSGRLEVDLSTAGNNVDDLKHALSGRAAVHFSMGSIKGFNLEQIIRRAEAKLKGRPDPPPGLKRTDFTELKASAEASNGVFTNEDLHATSNFIHATGSGIADIANMRLDYRLVPRFVDPPEGRGIKEIEGIPIPIRITGSFTRPDWKIELGPILREVAERRLKDKGRSRLKRLEEQTGIKGLEEGVRRLLGF